MYFSQAAVNGFVLPLVHCRESEKTKSAFSQRLRCTTAVDKLKEDPQLEGIHIHDIYPIIYSSRQVNRNDALSADPLWAMIEDIRNGLTHLPATLENKQVELWIITVSLLRYGKTRSQLEYILGVLQELGDENLKVRLMPLDAFGIPPERAMNILIELIEGVERIHRNICTNFDQGKNVVAEPSYVAEQQAVTSGAKTMKKRLMNESGLKDFIKRGTKLVTEANGNKTTTTCTMDSNNETSNIEIGYPLGRKRFEKKYLETMKELQNYSNGAERKELTHDKINTLKKYVAAYNNVRKLLGSYFRRSPGSRTAALCDNVPRRQASYNFSCIECHEGRTIEGIDVALFVDDQKRRSALANDAYVTFLAAILAGIFTKVYITLPARVSQHSVAIEMFCAACEISRVTVYFTIGLGKNIDELVLMEEEKHRLLKELFETYKRKMDNCRNEFLPSTASPGTITIRVSEVMKRVESSKVPKSVMDEYNAFDDNSNSRHGNAMLDYNDMLDYEDVNDGCSDNDDQDDDEMSIFSDWSIESDTEEEED